MDITLVCAIKLNSLLLKPHPSKLSFWVMEQVLYGETTPTLLFFKMTSSIFIPNFSILHQ